MDAAQTHPRPASQRRPPGGVLAIASACLLALLALVAGLPAAAQDEQAGEWFEQDQLNPGLPAPERPVNRDTPQAAMESFLFHASNGNFDAAAHLLDLTWLPQEEQATRGPSMAAKLETVIQRRVIIDWHALPDTEDGMEAQPAPDDPFAAKPRRSIRIWLVELEHRPVSIRLDRVKTPGADPVWVFSKQTVENIPALYNHYGPSRLELSLPDPLRAEGLWGLRVWEMIGLPLMIAAAAFFGWLARRVLTAMSRRDNSDLTESMLRSLRTPVVVLVVTFTVGTVTNGIFVFSGRISNILSPLVISGYVVAVMMLLVNVVDVLLDRLVVKQDADLSSREQEARRGLATHVAAWRRGLIVVIFIAGVGFVLTSANVFRALGFSLIGTAGIATVVLGFAGRDVLANILSSMQIALNQSARIGDTVLFRGYWCVVERINFTYVQLRVWDRTRLVVPVREFVSEPFENWTMMTPELHRVIKLRLAHSADVEALRRAFEDIARDLDQGDMADMEDAMATHVAHQDVHGLEVWFILPCNDANTAWAYACRVREALVARAAELEKERGAPFLPEVVAAEAS